MYGPLVNVSMGGIGVGLAVAIGDGLTADSISFIRPAGKVFIAAALAAERPPARINRTDLTQDAQLGLAHPNNHNSQHPKPNYQPLPISNTQLPKPSILLGVSWTLLGIENWALGVVGSW